jgi:hypothetical protein
MGTSYDLPDRRLETGAARLALGGSPENWNHRMGNPTGTATSPPAEWGIRPNHPDPEGGGCEAGRAARESRACGRETQVGENLPDERRALKHGDPIGSWETPVSGWARRPARNGGGETW